MFYNQAISGNALEARRSESCVLLGFSGGAICRDGDKPEEHLARKPRGLLGTRLHNRSREQTQRTKVTSRTRKGLPPSTPVRGHPHASPRRTGDCQPNGLLGGTHRGALVWIYSSGDRGAGFTERHLQRQPPGFRMAGGPSATRRGRQARKPGRDAGVTEARRARRQSRHTPWRRPPGKVGLTKPELPSAFLERDTGRSLAKPCGSAKASLRYVRASGTHVLRTEPPF